MSHLPDTPDDRPQLSTKRIEVRSVVSRYALSIIKWRWFPGCDVVRSRDMQALIPQLLFGLYIARLDGKRLTKAEASDLMGVDRATTGPKFIRALEEAGLVEIALHPGIDKRKSFLGLTKEGAHVVELEIERFGRTLVSMAETVVDTEKWAGVDLTALCQVPPGGPPDDELLPLKWPPENVGTNFPE